MPPFSLNGGANDREPTLIGDNQPQDTTGAEYRVGEVGIYVAKGRDLVCTVSNATNKGCYEASFDNENRFLIVHEGNSYHYATIGASMTVTLLDNLQSGTTAFVGCHHSNRHYVANCVENRRLEASGSGVTSFPVGMSATTFFIGNSVTQGSGSMTAGTWLEYWCTEYDSARGIESVFGSTTNTGAFSGKDSVIVTVTGTSKNPRADKIRWYRSTDGGGYPDGGLIQTTAIGTTQITDTSTTTSSLPTPLYGLVSIGGLDTARDEEPPAFTTIFGPYQDSLMAVSPSEPRVLRFTPAGYPDSWPSGYGIPIETKRNDQIVTGVVLRQGVGVFCNDSVHVIYRLPRDSDSVFSAGESQDIVTLERGCPSRRGATDFTPPGAAALAAFVSRDGIWITDLTPSPSPATDIVDWENRVNVSKLHLARLVDDPVNRRLVFLHWKKTDTTHATGIWYLDYQNFTAAGLRVTFANHGPLVDAATVTWTDGQRRLLSLDSRSGNGKVYVEATQDVDDSQLVNSSGAVNFRVRTKEFMPGGPRGYVQLGQASIMHDAGPSTITHRFYFDRRDNNPEVKTVPGSTTRNASEVMLGRGVNSFSLEIESTGTASYGIHWIDVEGLDAGPAGSIKGA